MEHTILFETEDIMVEFKGVFKNTFRLDELEFCNVKKRWLGYANSQLSVGINDREWQNCDKYKKEYEKLLKRERENEENKDEASDTENAKDYGWQGRRFYYKNERCYLPQEDIDRIIQILKDRKALCYRDGNISLGKGNRVLWMNSERIVTLDAPRFGFGIYKGVSTNDVEFASKKRRLFGILKSKFSVGVADWFDFKYNWVDYNTLNVKCSADEISEARDFLKTNHAICYQDGSNVVTTNVPLWKFWRRLFSDSDNLWMNSRHVVCDKTSWWDWQHGVIIPQIKFLYTKGFFAHDLYLGARGAIRVDNVSSRDKTAIEQHLKNNGAKIALDSLADYHDVFTLGDLFKVKNWFVSSTISVTKNGIKMTQKTFKTNDNIYLPFEKINFAETYGGHSLLGARHIRIYGEQHIMPIRKYSKSATKEILKCLEEHGIRVKSFLLHTIQVG